MATPIEIEQQIDELKKILDALNTAEIISENKFRANNKTYTKAQLSKEVETLSKDIKALEKVVKPYRDAQAKVKSVGAVGPGQELTPTQKQMVATAQAEVNRLAGATLTVPSLSSSLAQQVAPAVPVTPSVGGAPSAGAVRTEQEKKEKPKGAAQGPFGGGSSAAQFRMAEEKIKVKAQETVKEETTTTTTAGGGGGGGDKIKQPALPKNWEATFRRMFPNNAWLLDLDRTKYPKLFELVQRGVRDRMFETTEGQQRFDAELKNTDFYVELRNTDKVRQIKSLVGDLGFDSVPFNKFLTTASNFGWEGETLKQEVYKEAFRKNDAGQYVNPTAVTRAKSSNNYLAIANIGKAYFSQVADSTIENALTGGITTEDVQRQQRELAKTKYGHLSNLIEQGFTLQELSQPFQQQAAAILERTPDAIDMSQAMFEAAYNYGEPGQKRMMTSGEWEIMLRSDAKYGWDKTENAKREARQLATSITQAFGKVI